MRVHINFGVIENNANSYLNFSKELNEIIKGLNDSRKSLMENWISTNSIIFNNQFSDYIGELQVDSNKMQRYWNVLLGINDDFKKTDLEYAKKSALDMEEDMYGFE